MTCPAGVHQARAWVKVLSESLESAQKTQEETFGTAVKNVSGDIIKVTHLMLFHFFSHLLISFTLERLAREEGPKAIL